MKKIVTPENFMIAQANLFIWGLMLDKLHHKELGLVLIALQVGLIFFCLGFLWWDANKEVEDLKKKMAGEKQKRLEDDVRELKQQVAELQYQIRYANQSKILN